MSETGVGVRQRAGGDSLSEDRKGPVSTRMARTANSHRMEGLLALTARGGEHEKRRSSVLGENRNGGEKLILKSKIHKTVGRLGFAWSVLGRMGTFQSTLSVPNTPEINRSR